MSHTATVSGDPVARTLSWIATRGVELRPWNHTTITVPPDPVDHPVLYLVEPGVEPPRCHECEDWIRLPLDVAELTARADRLIAWSRDAGALYTRVDDDDVLRVGDDMVVLSELEARLVRTLIDSMGMLVLRADLVEAVWPDGPPSDPRALDNRVKSVRARLAGLPLRIHTIHGRGLILERMRTGDL